MNKKHVLAALSIVMLSACGGGSSGSSNTPPQSPTPTPTPTPEPEPTGAVFADSPADYSALAVGSFDSLLQLGFLTANLISQDKPSVNGAERSCTNGGIIQSEYSAPDSPRLETGEQLTVSLQECARTEVGDVISGTIAITVTSVDDAQQTMQLSVDFSDAEIGSQVPLVVIGELNVGLDHQSASTAVSIASESTLTITGEDDLALAFDDVQITHVRNKQTAKYSLSGSGSVLESHTIDAFGMVINEPFVGFFGEYPHQGMMTLSSDVSDDLTIEANFVEGSEYFDITYAGQSENLAWWYVVEGAIWSLDGNYMEYAQSFRSDNFAALGSSAGDTNNFPLMGGVEFYFSRPVAHIEPETLKFTAWDWGYESIEGVVSINGAVVTVTPSRPLQAGKEYYLSDFIAYTAGGQSDWAYTVSVVASTDAVATIRSSSVFIKPDDTPLLTAEASFTNGDEIASVTWVDSKDTGLVFSSQGERETELDLSAVDSSLTELNVVAEVISTRGLIAYASVVLNVVPDSDAVLAYTSEPGDYIGAGNSDVLTDADGAFTLSYSEEGDYVSLYFNGADSWSLDIASAQGEPLAPGKYQGATRWPFQSPTKPGLSFTGSGRGCNESYGEFEVFELEISAIGVERLAVDWSQHCEREDAPVLRGSLRYNSGHPISL